MKLVVEAHARLWCQVCDDWLDLPGMDNTDSGLWLGIAPIRRAVQKHVNDIHFETAGAWSLIDEQEQEIATGHLRSLNLNYYADNASALLSDLERLVASCPLRCHEEEPDDWCAICTSLGAEMKEADAIYARSKRLSDEVSSAT